MPDRAFSKHEIGAVPLVSALWAVCSPVITSTVRYAPPLGEAIGPARIAGMSLVAAGMVAASRGGGSDASAGRDGVDPAARGYPVESARMLEDSPAPQRSGRAPSTTP